MRTDFPLTKKKIYMNNGSIAPTPLSTIKAITDTFLKYSIEGPDSKLINEFINSLIAELWSRLSSLIHCEPEEIIFTQSTTEGLNYVRNGINWKKGDSVIVRGGTHEHYANHLPWLQLSREKGVDMINLLVIYEEVGKITKENDILFCVDAAQTIGSIETDVKKMDCDFMAFPSFKWVCGPLGLGILYCSKKADEILKPQSIISESATLSSDQKTLAYLEPPFKFQTGFRNFPALAGLEASVRYLLRLGMKNICSKNMKVANLLRNELDKMVVVPSTL